MADAKAAVDAVMRQEDARLSGIITNRASDRGGLTRFGLTAKNHPLLLNAGFFDASLPAAAAFKIAETTYQAEYTGTLYLVQIASQAIATALLSFAVNAGNTRAISLLQRALLVNGQSVGLDGKMGPATVAAINACDAKQLLNHYCDLEAMFYRGLAEKDPTQNANLKGWLNRVAADRALAA